MIDALFDLSAGHGRVAVSDFGRKTDVIQAQEYIARHFWFGSGAATKLVLFRTQSIHHAVYHIWVEFSVFGAALYALLCGLPCVQALITFRCIAKTNTAGAVLPLIISMSGLVVAPYILGLHIPAIFINFRRASVGMIATTLLYATSWPAHTPRPAPRHREGQKTRADFTVTSATAWVYGASTVGIIATLTTIMTLGGIVANLGT